MYYIKYPDIEKLQAHTDQPPPKAAEPDSGEEHSEHHEKHDGKYDEDDKKNEDDDDCNHKDKDDKGITRCSRKRPMVFIGAAIAVLVVVTCLVGGVCFCKWNNRRKQVSDSVTNLQEKKVARRAENYVVAIQNESTTKPPLDGPIIVPSLPQPTPTSPPPPYEKY
ncbi:hypothetical protein KUTeg_016492 [Tegillarca granosa]|uniref:Uncharacterized protein n=1 Tax=Tegillarca granosa TaxID=220873 RepID=A0ABQ9EL13_TEGGR|nr:hypothetical protein KUTeg_016492 [Tegillarca granosa]